MEVEALAATQALEFGLETGIDCVIVEGDSTMVVKALANEDVTLAYIIGIDALG